MNVLHQRQPSLTESQVTHPIVDSDGHVVEPPDLWKRYLPAEFRDRAPIPVDPDDILKAAMTMDGKPFPRPTGAQRYKGMSKDHSRERLERAFAAGFSPRSQLDSMDEEGIDAAVLFPSRGLFLMGSTGFEARFTSALAEAYNRWLSEFCAEDPQRLVGAAMLDPRDVDAARTEVRRCVREYGFGAVFIRPNFVNGIPWHDPVYDPLWSDLEDLDVPLCFHEGAAVYLPQVGPDRFAQHAFWHTCTHPMEQQIAMVSVLMGGVAERHPRLRIAFLECGAGWLPYWLWRMDEHVETEEEEFPYLRMTPSEYARRQCFVSVDTDETPGMATIELGHSVVWGSDYPHADGKFPLAARTLRTLAGMDDTRYRSVVFETPQKLFGRKFSSRIAQQE